MIHSLSLRNFQGHKATDIEFGPGINVIAGQSDSGKSSIIRALRWIIDNRPARAGEAFKYHGADKGDEVSASITITNSTDVGQQNEIVRFRKGGENGYMVDGTKLVAIRSDVPQEVTDILNLGAHNLQTQHDPYFLVADSPADVARKLNGVCGLDIIDTCLKSSSTLIARNRDDSSRCREEIQIAESKLHQYTDLDGRERALVALEDVAERLVSLDSRLQSLPVLIEQLNSNQIKLTRFDAFLKAETQLVPLVVLQQEETALVRRETTLSGLIMAAEQAVQQAEGLDELLALSPKVGELLGVSHRIAIVLDPKIKSLGDLIQASARQETEIKGKDAGIASMEDQFHSLLEAGGVCPLCEQEIR